MPEIGISVIGSQLDNNPMSFVERLNLARETGFGAIEISPDDFDLISCGRLQMDIAAKLKSILSDYNFKVSIHVPLGLNLFNTEFPDYTGTYMIELTERFFYPAKIREAYANLKNILDQNIK